MKEKVISWTIKGFLLLLMVILSTSFLFAEPSGPAVINVSAPETRGTTAAMEVKAQAGNITALSIDATTVTKSWQGYYGNISGSVTLDDNVNYTMYSWSAVTPEGEVYASNASSVTWSNIKCINFTGNMSENQINVTVLEDMFGMGAADSDGVNETFSTLYVDSNGFYVGSVQINTDDNCPLTYTFVNETAQTTSFKEVLLTDNTSVVFTTLIENDVNGYKGENQSDIHDFQMIVGEDGHQGSAGPTSYYFFVELG